MPLWAGCFHDFLAIIHLFLFFIQLMVFCDVLKQQKTKVIITFIYHNIPGGLFLYRLKKIESSLYDGSDRRRIASILPQHPFGLTVFENFVYYTDWYKYGRGIRKLNKFTGRNQERIRRLLWSHMDIQVYHPLRQPNGELLIS